MTNEKQQKPSEVILGLFILGLLILGGYWLATSLFSGDNDTEQSTIQQQEETPTIKPTSFELVEEKDISFAGCKRVQYKVKVDPASNNESVSAMQDGLIESNKSEWDDITVFTYSNEKDDESIKLGIYDIDKAEYSTCE